MPEKLTFDEILTIRRALEQYSQRASNAEERKQAEDLQWRFKDASEVVLRD